MTVEIECPKLKDQITGGILGLAVADALGVPVEFQNREPLRRNPVTDMRGYGTYNQPPGTWSDDTSLTLCLLDSLASGKIDYADIMQKFISWASKGEYTALGNVFDIGIATRKALQRFKEGTDPLQCGGTSEQDNGNGSLMRMLPIVFYLDALFMNWHYDWAAPQGRGDSVWSCYIQNVSSLTHVHKRSQIACGIYGLIAFYILKSSDDDTKSLKRARSDIQRMFIEKLFYATRGYSVPLQSYVRLENVTGTMPVASQSPSNGND